MTQDRRRHKRFLIGDMDVKGKMLFNTSVRVVDMSINGMCLVTDKRLEIGEHYTLRIESGEHGITVKCKVVWSSINNIADQTEGGPSLTYRTGFEFIDIFTERGQAVLRFLGAEAGTGMNRPRLKGIRMKIRQPDKALLFYYQSCCVKKISRGGILIEMDHPLAVEDKLNMELLFQEEDEPLKIYARVASCQEVTEGTTPAFDVGIEFIEMSTEDESRVQEFINMLENL